MVEQSNKASAGKSVVVVGCGIAGLSAAVSAMEHGARVSVLERSPKEERGGQTSYTEAYLRMKSETEVSDDFETHLAENAGGYMDPSLVHAMSADRDNWPRLIRALCFTDPDFIATFSTEAGPTVAWLERHGAAVHPDFCARATADFIARHAIV